MNEKHYIRIRVTEQMLLEIKQYALDNKSNMQEIVENLLKEKFNGSKEKNKKS
jgi:hypothetical protein